jgi:ParB family chromosome partitioning protein
MTARREGKRALGRGLDALFGEVSVSAPAERGGRGPSVRGEGEEADKPGENDIRYLPVDDIKPNPAQPRQEFSEESLEGLASSIEKHGLIQPIIVKQGKTGYELIAGERRWRAARKAGLREIPSIIREVSAEENALFALIENVQREDLNPLEEAQAYQGLMKDYGFTQEEVAKSVGKSRPYIANTVRLLKLPEKVRRYLSEGKLSSGHANAIGSLVGDDAKVKLADRIVQSGLSVREAEALAQEIKGNKGKRKKSIVRGSGKDPAIRMVEEELTTLYGTKVTIGKSVSRGAVEFHYYSKDELDGLIEEFLGLRG